MFQKVIICGRLGKDPQTYQSGATEFSVAVDAGKNETEWFNVVAFGKTAEICQRYLTKGKPVVISGRMRTSKYDKNGETRYITKLVADEMRFVGGDRKDASQESRGEGRGLGDWDGGGEQPSPEDDVPF